jgi:hypothetical protein
MINVMLTNWVTYVYIAWVIVLVVAALWPGKKGEGPGKSGRFSPASAVNESE